MAEIEEHPVIEIENVEPVFVRAMMLGAMAVRYCRAVPSLELSEGYEAARATWGTDWPDDPAPRTFDAAEQAVDGDLECWEEL